MYHRRKIFKRKRRNFGRKRKAFVSRKRRRRVGRGGGFAKRVKAVVMDQLTCDNSYVNSYADYSTTGAALDAPATQGLILGNLSASGTAAANTRTMLHMDDPLDLETISVAVSGTVKSGRFTRKSCRKEAILTNTHSSECTIWEYRCQARRDQTIQPYTTYTQGFLDAEGTGGGSITPLDYYVVGATPFMNPRFVAQFKIVKTRKRVLKPGSSWRISYTRKKNRQITREAFAPNNTERIMCRGDRFSLFIHHGSFGVNVTGATTKEFGMTISVIGSLMKSIYHYSWISDTSSSTGADRNIFSMPNATTTFVPAPVVVNNPMSAITEAAVRVYAYPPGPYGTDQTTA